MKTFSKKMLIVSNSFRLVLNDNQDGYMERVEKITSSILKRSDCVAKNIDIALLADEFEKSWQHTNDFSQIRRTLYKWLPVVFFYRQTSDSHSKYYKDGSIDKFVNHCIEHDDERSLRRIYSELLIHYPQDERMYKLLTLSINFIRSKKRAGAKMLLDSEKQLELSTRNAPLKTATLFVGNFNETTNNFFDNLWLREDHLKSGFGGAVLKELCLLASKYLLKSSRKLYLPLIYFIENICLPKNVVEKDMIINSLLLPFSDTEPDSTSKTEITSFTDRFIGDPRLKPNEWLTVPKSREIYLRWKIGQTLEAFFKIISNSTQGDKEADRQWEYRKEFYYEYFKVGTIKEAWIILGPDAHDSKGLFFEDSSVKTGRISGGERRNKSALLIKIGNLIISEWSHEGAMRFWSNDEEHPKLYKDKYYVTELRMKSKKSLSHFGPDRYYWQSKAAEYIKRKTGIKSPSRKF